MHNLGGGARLAVRGIDPDGLAINVDVELTEPTGERWGVTVLTLSEVDRLMKAYRVTGECQSGRFFRASDLLIVESPILQDLVNLMGDLFVSGEHRQKMLRLDDV